MTVRPAAATALEVAAVGMAARWTVVRVSSAVAAGIAAYLVTGGMSEVEAAEAVKPLVDKRILAIANVTGKAEWADPKPGQETSIGGQNFNAIIRLTTR